MSTQLVLHEGNQNQFALLANDDGQSIFAEMMDLGIKDHQIPIVKIPGSAGTSWQVVLADGEEISSKELDVVIVWVSPGHRTFFEKSYDESEDGEQPLCSSEMDGRGFGAMTDGGEMKIRECGKCPQNKFGSARNGKGRACSEYTVLYCLLPEQILPIRVRISPGSLESLTKYSIGCLSGGTKVSSVITRITLVEAGKKPNYSIATFKKLSALSPEHAKIATDIGDTLKASMPRRSAEMLKERHEGSEDDGAKNGSVIDVDATVTESGEDPFPKE